MVAYFLKFEHRVGEKLLLLLSLEERQFCSLVSKLFDDNLKKASMLVLRKLERNSILGMRKNVNAGYPLHAITHFTSFGKDAK